MKKMYVSLPITGRDLVSVKEHAEKVKGIWEKKGYEVITPFDVCKKEGKSYNYCMGKDIEALLECDGIILCHDWFSSKGCRAECAVAEVYGKIIKTESTIYAENQV